MNIDEDQQLLLGSPTFPNSACSKPLFYLFIPPFLFFPSQIGCYLDYLLAVNQKKKKKKNREDSNRKVSQWVFVAWAAKDDRL